MLICGLKKYDPVNGVPIVQETGHLDLQNIVMRYNGQRRATRGQILPMSLTPPRAVESHQLADHTVDLRMPLLAKLMQDTNPDIVCLQETKTRDEFFPLNKL